MNFAIERLNLCLLNEFHTNYIIGNEKDNADDPLCGCTIIDKDHEATITYNGLANYFELLHRHVSFKFFIKIYFYSNLINAY